MHVKGIELGVRVEDLASVAQVGEALDPPAKPSSVSRAPQSRPSSRRPSSRPEAERHEVGDGPGRRSAARPTRREGPRSFYERDDKQHHKHRGFGARKSAGVHRIGGADGQSLSFAGKDAKREAAEGWRAGESLVNR